VEDTNFIVRAAKLNIKPDQEQCFEKSKGKNKLKHNYYGGEREKKKMDDRCRTAQLSVGRSTKFIHAPLPP
jgi:hypothetical protein